MTTMKTALRKAGIVPPKQRLIDAMDAAIGDASTNRDDAFAAFHEAISDDAEAVLTLFEAEEIVYRMRRRFEMRYQEFRRERAKQNLTTGRCTPARRNQSERDEANVKVPSGHSSDAPALTPIDGDGHRHRDTHFTHAEAVNPIGGGANHYSLQGQPSRASTSDPDSSAEGRRTLDAQTINANRAAKPIPIDATIRAATRAAMTVLDSYRMPNGKALGDCTRGDLERMKSEGFRIGYVCKLVLRKAAHVPDGAVAREWLDVQDAQRAIQQAAEAADAA